MRKVCLLHSSQAIRKDMKKYQMMFEQEDRSSRSKASKVCIYIHTLSHYMCTAMLLHIVCVLYAIILYVSLTMLCQSA